MKQKNILIIDDSYTSLVLMDYTMKAEGFKTQLAQNVNEAIELIKKDKPDLIILDLNLPDVSGYDFLNMRKKLNIENIPIIVVSAMSSKESIEKSFTLGTKEFFTKPVDLDSVVNRVKELVK